MSLIMFTPNKHYFVHLKPRSINASTKECKGWRMVLQKIWVSQNFSGISRVSQSRFFSRFEVSESRFFCNVQKSQISRSRNLNSGKVSASQRKTLVSPSRKVSILPFATPNVHWETWKDWDQPWCIFINSV